MSLKDRLQSDTKTALKAGDKDRLKVLRLTLAAIKQQEVDQRVELDEAAVLGILTKMVKQRRDSITQFTDGGRDDLAAAEQQEIAVLEDYLPQPLSDAEVETLVSAAIEEVGAAGLADMGKVMGLVKSRSAGRADLGKVSSIVKQKLA